MGPVFSTDTKPGHHRYLIEFRRKPDNLDRFARLIDEELCRLNEDYQAHRAGDLTMLGPDVVVVGAGGLGAWLRLGPITRRSTRCRGWTIAAT